MLMYSVNESYHTITVAFMTLLAVYMGAEWAERDSHSWSAQSVRVDEKLERRLCAPRSGRASRRLSDSYEDLCIQYESNAALHWKP